MTPEQKAAFVMAQTQLMAAEAEQMKAENIMCQAIGLTIAYGPMQWGDFRERWEALLGYNALSLFFRDECV